MIKTSQSLADPADRALGADCDPIPPTDTLAPRPLIIVEDHSAGAMRDLIDYMRNDYEVCVADRSTILATPDLKPAFAIVISQSPSEVTVREFCAHLRRTHITPPKLIAAGPQSSPWLTFVERQAQIDGIICHDLPIDQQIRIFGLLANEDAEQTVHALGDRAIAIWNKASGLINNIEALTQARQPIPQTVIHDFAKVLVEDPDDALFLDIVAALRDHHSETLVHCLDMAITAMLLGRHLGIRNREDHYRLFEAGLMHDVGKTVVPRSILDKPGKLTAAEFEVIRQHPIASERILLESGGYDQQVVRAASEHHERNDGTGYPKGLKSAQISEIGRLMAVCDIYCALTERRSYKSRLTAIEAFKILRSCVGPHLDHVLVERLIEMITGHLGPRIHGD